ncbi:GspH/FimT family pseudopilin [Stenotrophomonas sp. GbtcB23]|jgi:type IV fimbrial biogenesis protein FimT|uniref:GspH/FimT family pseudopilin n=1 Tax=Stenotrophomonas sp. GbtcB23 TaxID=2824768 RepID=UPI002671C271|nr:GspH/FimT family pseudopilin [Stenotrophomonas sp. GbtcB23]
MHLRTSKGFTLIELMVTVVVIGVVAAIAFPNFQNLIRSNRIATAHNELIGLVNLARSDAIRNNQGGAVCGSSTGTSCDGKWNVGMLAFSDSDGDGVLGNTEPVLRYTSINKALVVAGPPGAMIGFDGRGRRRNSTDQEVTLRPEKCDNQPLQSTLTINASGQVTTVKGPCK